MAETTLGPKKFILLSAHDTTLINWLTAIAPAAWDSSEWPPYAALAIIEVLRIGAGGAGAAAVGNKMGDYFRFVYNGKVLRLEGCDQGEEKGGGARGDQLLTSLILCRRRSCGVWIQCVGLSYRR